ncbi:MAG: hypothetical protein E7071_02415 [Bacteroidales bacterium]|nr:hypothetical protein [Bacteroidales bacterium]
MKRLKMKVGATLVMMFLVGIAVAIPRIESNGGIFSENVEAISSGESFWNTFLWHKMWTECKVEKTRQTTVSSGTLNYNFNTIKYGTVGYTGTPYSSTTTTVTYENGRKSYCYDGRSLCASNDCR